MKKTIVTEYEATVCDKCGREEDCALRLYVHQCLICKSDICDSCGVTIVLIPPRVGGVICREHIKGELPQ